MCTRPRRHASRLWAGLYGSVASAATPSSCGGAWTGRADTHEFRHSAASLAVAAGANVKSIQRPLRHASGAMTLDVYTRLFDDDRDAVADRLSEGLTG
jgi:integrase